jgi:hypothetical protein
VDGHQYVEAAGNNIGECFEDLEKSYPGVLAHVLGTARQTAIDYLVRIDGMAFWARELDLATTLRHGAAVEVIHIPDGG